MGAVASGETFGQHLSTGGLPMDVPLWLWLTVLAVIAVMLAVDLLAHRRAHVVPVREAAV